MIRSLFPGQHMEDYLAQHLLPDELSELRIKANCTTLKDLLNYNHNILLLLESNAVHDNRFTLQGPAFEALFKRYTPYYDELDSTEQILELLRTEQTIHFITNSAPATQDISSYLKIVEHLCEQEDICELILLLSKKHSTWCEGYSEQYAKWLHFLIPFFQYSQSVLFEAHRVLALRDAGGRSSLTCEMIKTNVSHLKSLLAGDGDEDEVMKKVVEELDEERLGDVDYVLEEVPKLKKMMVEGSQNRDDQFYYKLGVISFVIQLVKFCVSENDTFLKICLMTTLYNNVFDEFNKVTASETLKSTQTNENSCKPMWWRGLLDDLCKKLQDKDQSPSSQAVNIHTLQCLLCVIDAQQKTSANSKALLDKELVPLVLELINALYQNRQIYSHSQSFYSGGFLNHNENYARDFLFLVKMVQPALAKDPTNLAALYEKTLDISKNIQLRSLLQDKCFKMLKELAVAHKSQVVPNNWNIGEVNLKNLMKSKEKPAVDNLATNLKVSLELFVSQSSLSCALEDQKHEDLVEIFELYISQARKNRFTKQEIEKLKQIGIFLTGFLKCRLSDFEEVRSRFLSSFVDFLMGNCVLDCWDIFYLQEYFWGALLHVDTWQRIRMKPAFSKLLAAIEREAIKGQFPAKLFPNGLMINDAKMRRELRDTIIESLADIEDSLRREYNSFDWSKCEQKQQEKIHVINLLNRKLVYFTIQLTKCFLKSTDKSLPAILESLMRLYFHPAFCIFSKKAESNIMDNCFVEMMSITKYFKWKMYNASYEVVANITKDMNKDIWTADKGIGSFLSASSIDGTVLYQIKDLHRSEFKNLSLKTAAFFCMIHRLKGFSGLAESIKEKRRNETTFPKEQEKALGQSFHEAMGSLFALANQFACSYKPSASTEDDKITEITEMMNIIAIGVRETLITLQKVRTLASVADNLFSELFNIYLKNAHKKGSQFILHLFTTLAIKSESKRSDQNWRQTLCQRGVLTFVVRRLYELIAPKDIDEKEYAIQLKSIDAIASLLQTCFTEIKFTKIATHNKNITKQKNRDFLPNLFYELDEALEDFPIYKLLLKEDEQLTKTFQTVLYIFDRLEYASRDQSETVKWNYNRRYREDPAKIARIRKAADETIEKVQEKYYVRASLMSVASERFYSIKKHNSEMKHVKLEKVWDSCKKIVGKYIASDWEKLHKVIKQDNFLPNWQDIMGYVTKGITGHWAEQCAKKQDLAPLVKKTGDWVEFVLKAHLFTQMYKNFDLLAVKSSLLENIEKLAHLDILFGERTFSTYSPLIKIMLSLEKKESWSMANVFSVGLMLDNFIKPVLPDSVQLQLDLKRIIINSANWPNPLKLADLDKDGYIKEKEQTHMQTLVDVMTKKFRIYSNCEEIKSEKAFSVENLFIALDVSQEISDPASSIEFVLQNLSQTGKAVIDLLMESLLENFLANINSIKADNSNPKLRETSNIMMILSMFLQKYCQLTSYLAFQKHDYSLIVKKYHKELAAEEFRSITFLDCLLKMKYFSYNLGDFSMLIVNLIQPTGVTFANSDATHYILDISFIIINKVFGFIHDLFEENCQRKPDNFIDSIEKFTGLQTSLNLFGFLWYQVRQIYNKEIFAKYFKDLFLSGLKNIISHLPDIIADHSCYPEICNLLLDYLPDQIRYHFDKEYDASAEEIKQFKRDNYQILLEDYHKADETQLLKTICEHLKINTDIKNKEIVVASSEVSLEDVQIAQTDKKDETRSWTRMQTLSLTPISKSYFHLKSWEKVSLEMISKIKEFNSASLLNASEKIVSENLVSYLKWNDSSMKSYSTYKGALADIIPCQCAIELDKLKQTELEPISHDLKFKRYYHVISEKLKTANPAQEQEQEKVGDSMIMEIEYEKTAIREEEEDVSVTKEEVKKDSSSDAFIKYFKDLGLRGKNDFEFIQEQILSRLKLLSEKVLLESHCGPQDGEEIAVRKEAINCEIKEHLKNLPELERNLYLCLIEEFDALSCFEYPENYSEIKEEYRWIVTNFSDYLKVLALLRGEDGNSIAHNQENINAGLIFTKDFTFCNDFEVSLELKSKAAIKISDDMIKAVKTLFSTDDNVVESITTCFYLVNQDSTTSKHLQIISQLCGSALFEAKLVDYCFFLLYSPDYLELAKQSKIYDERIMNVAYNDMVHNVLYFLNDLLQNKDYLLYQPRVYFENHSLKSLKEFKTQTQFYKQTARMISIADLLIGLLDLKHIQDDKKLNDMLRSLIENIFSKSTNFNVIEGKVGEEMIEKKKVITRESGQKLMQMENSDNLLESLVNFIPFELDGTIQATLKQQKEISQPLKDIALAVKYMDSIKEEEKETQVNYIMTVHKYGDELVKLEKSLSVVSFLMSSWVLDENDCSGDEQNSKNERLKESFRRIHCEILENKELCDFMSDVFCITSYLPGKKEIKEPELKSALPCLFNICVYYYTLYCAQEEIIQAGVQVSTIIERTNTNFSRFEGIMVEMSQSMREKQSYFEELFTTMYKANTDIANMAISENLSLHRALLKGGKIISDKLPWMMLGFESKKKNLMNSIKKDMAELGAEETRTISIERRNLVQSTLEAFANKPLRVTRQKVGLKFQNEHGVDGGGLRKEWITIINRELFNPQTGLFELCEDNVTLQISPLAKNIPSHLKYLQLAGMMLAKAIQMESVVNVTLSNSLLKHILNLRATLNDLKSIDSGLAKSLEWMLHNSPEGLEQDFTYETEAFGYRFIRELIRNGYNITVTDTNKHEFVNKMCEVKMKGEVQEEIIAFLKGFYLVIPAEFLQGLFPGELQLLISGPATIDVNEIKATAKLSSYTSSCNVVRWLWEVLFSFNQTELSAFVLFVTGSPKIAYRGLQSKSFIIQKGYDKPSSLPIARTCSWVIEIPAYCSKEELRQKLLLAIFDGQGGFMFA